MRVYKVKAFGRFQRREKIADATLVKAVRDAERGLIDADLGDGLIKQRVARRGQGKRGGYRTLIAYQRDDLAVFLFGFAKNERDNIDAAELAIWRSRANGVLKLSAKAIAEEIAADELTEVSYGENDEEG